MNAAHGEPAWSEPIRLVIWDLDETFWKGTLTEGGIEQIPSHCELLCTLARRGIVSSICSRNDAAAVERVLTAAGVWQYFVLPSVSWEAKGPRLRLLVESLQLRPASVLFIDDNHVNREEARQCVPDLKVCDPGFIATLAQHPLFQGKDDAGLTRLAHYRQLAERKTAADASQGDTLRFLRSCDIVVAIEHDVASHLDRAIELINRTNQLNFVKSRLPEDRDAARRELAALLAGHDIQAGLIRVTDRYGDHGFCGIYVLRSTQRLLQFAFSCRILGLGVERWVYGRLGCPGLPPCEDVLVDLTQATDPVDWIRLQEPGAARLPAVAASPAVPAAEPVRLFARGGCNLQAVHHYFNVSGAGSAGEFNLNRDACDVRIDHSMFLRYAVTGLPVGALPACERLNYRAADFTSVLLEPAPGRAAWLLSFWSDAVFALYRHRETGVTLPFMLPYWHDQAKDITAASDAVLADRPAHALLLGPLQYLRSTCDYLGIISERLFKENLKIILGAAPRSTRVVIVGANEHFLEPQTGIRHQSEAHAALNQWTRSVVRWRRNVMLLNVRDFIESDAEVHNWDHFDRRVYYRIYKEMERLISPRG